MFSAFLHAEQYFVDSVFHYSRAIRKKEQYVILAGAPYNHSAELWNCCLGNVYWPELKRMQTLFKGAGNSGGRCGRLGIVELHRIVNGLSGAT